MKKFILPLMAVLLSLNMLFAVHSPKREFRGVWLSTVDNIDWPSSKYDSDTKKQNDLKAYLQKAKDSGLNSVLFQVRCACDAMYKSDIDPWSYWFSGKQGQGPSVDWDPLEFAIEEAHKLGMELHAWVNPYRAVKTPSYLSNPDYISNDHVTIKHPDWILKFSDIYILDPGLPEVRNYIETVLMDIVTRYDIDGLHMDDYFYPYSVIHDEDSSTFANYSRGIEDVHDWRRDNINLLVEAVMDSINEVKPWVKWGISPFGVWKPGVPSGISSMDAFNILYCDPIAWLTAQTVDYITPQLYWPFGGGQDYGKLVPWWAEQAYQNGRHFYPGQAMSRAGVWERGEIPRQVRFNRATDHCDGSVFFTANDFYDNHLNTIDSLRLDLYRYPALWPVMTWKDSIAPGKPQNIQIAVDGAGSKTINWDAPGYTDPMDSAYAYVIYRANSPVDAEDMANAAEIQFDLSRTFEDDTEGMYYYALSTLDRNKLESEIEYVKFDFTDPLYPAYASSSVPVQLPLIWSSNEGATQYTVELSLTDDFTSPLEQYSISDTSKDFTLEYATDYFWRVKADNSTYWSPVWSFKTQLPPQVNVITPFAYHEGESTGPELKWKSFEDASSYDIQLATDESMANLVLSETSIADTSRQLSGLDYNTEYFWRVRSNKYDRWTDVMSFKTKEEYIGTLWEKTTLAQKYPAFMDSSLEAGGLALGHVGNEDVLLIAQSLGDSIKVNALNALTGENSDLDLNLDGINGGLYALRDIEISSDGVIYASNCVDSGDTLKVYQWLDPAQPAQCVYTAEDVAFRLGDHITVDGRYDDGSITIYAAASNHYKLLKLTWNSVSSEFEAEQISLSRMQKSMASVALIPGNDNIFVNSIGYTIREFSTSGQTLAIMSEDTGMPIKAHSTAGFKYNDKPYLVSYSKTTESAYILDVYDGTVQALSAGGTYKLGIESNLSSAGDVEVMDNGDGSFTIFVLGNQNGVAAYNFDAASASVGIAELNGPGTFELGQNYPNPFNPVTIVPLNITRSGNVKINIYDISGKLVKALQDGYLYAGQYEFRFDGSGLSSGQYIYRVSVGDVSIAKKMLLIK